MELAQAEWWYFAGNGTFSVPLTKEEKAYHERHMWEFLFMAAESGELSEWASSWYCPMCGRHA